MSKVLELRLPQHQFDLILKGYKKFVLQPDTQRIALGDIFVIHEHDAEDTENFTGRIHAVKVSHVVRNAVEHGLKDGFCIVGWK